MFVIGERTLTGLQDRETLDAVIEDKLAVAKNADERINYRLRRNVSCRS